MNTSIRIHVEPAIAALCPRLAIRTVESLVTNGPTPPALWDEIAILSAQLRQSFTVETLKQRSGIAATRQAYKACGKDPSRYRPSCEQLARRVLQGKELYSINSLVDLGNLLSLSSGYSVGVLDADKISGRELSLGIGRIDEPYEAIGRGPLNIEGMPVYRDALGAVATPTSDSVRTQIDERTKHVLIIINGYDGDGENLDNAVRMAKRLVEEYAGGKPKDYL